MEKRHSQLLLYTSPVLVPGTTTPRLMADVIIALLPPIFGAVWFFGLSAILILLTSTLTAVAFEKLFPVKHGKISDGSAALTGLLVGLTLPPNMPLWMVFVGSAVAILLGKSIWGGLGQNIFNPALIGRAFLQAAFPSAITTWNQPLTSDHFWKVPSSLLALPLMKGNIDFVTTATPLAQMKFSHQTTAIATLLTGNTAGSLGETSGILLIIGGIYLLWRRAFDWRIPTSILLSAALFSAILHYSAPLLGTPYPSPLFTVFSGGLLFGAIYMATDPVTSPLSPAATWLFGIGIGLLVVLIRNFGGLPEGVMYAILLMNAATPLLDRAFPPTPYGRRESPNTIEKT